jgi:hypothetical protein
MIKSFLRNKTKCDTINEINIGMKEDNRLVSRKEEVLTMNH